MRLGRGALKVPNDKHLLAQFDDLRIRLDELQQEFTQTTNLDKRVQLTLQMQAVIEQADTLIRSRTQALIVRGVPD